MREIKPHTGLRGVAAVVVMLAHLSPVYFFASFDSLVPFLPNNQAVDLFFVLSGFILSYVYLIPGKDGPQGGYKNFQVARFARVYPLHLATLLVLSGMILVMSRQGQITNGFYRIEDFFRQLLLINSYPLLSEGRTWNYPAWSISIEYFAYLLIFPLFLKCRPRRMAPEWSLLFILTMTLGEVACIHGVVLWENMQQSLWIGLMRGVVGFVSGCLLHDLYASHPDWTKHFQRHATTSVVIVILIVVLAGYGYLSQWWLLLAWPPLVLGLTSEQGLASKALSSRVALFFGNLSYSIYMLHAVVGKLANVTIYRHTVVLTSPWLQIAGCLYLSFVVALSWLSFRFFEMPTRFWLRSLLNRPTVV